MAISKKRNFSVADDMNFTVEKSQKSAEPKKEAAPAPEVKPASVVTHLSATPIKEVRSVGRPKGDQKKAITIYLPVDTYEEMNNGPIPMLRGKVSEYIVSLIKNDLRENADAYKRISEVMSVNKK